MLQMSPRNSVSDRLPNINVHSMMYWYLLHLNNLQKQWRKSTNNIQSQRELFPVVSVTFRTLQKCYHKYVQQNLGTVCVCPMLFPHSKFARHTQLLVTFQLHDQIWLTSLNQHFEFSQETIPCNWKLKPTLACWTKSILCALTLVCK